MGTKTYTDDEKAEAVRLYYEHDADYAAAEVGCSRRSVYSWVALHSSHEKEHDEEWWENWQRETRLLLADQVHELIHRQNEPHSETRITFGGPVEIVHHKATAGDARNYAVSMGIVMDKLLLLMGEATSRTEVHELPSRELIRSWVDALTNDIANR